MATPTTTTGWILRVGSYAGIAGALLAVLRQSDVLLMTDNAYDPSRAMGRGLLADFGPKRIVDTPIAEEGFVGEAYAGDEDDTLLVIDRIRSLGADASSVVEIVDETRFSGEIVLEPEPTSFRAQREPSGFMELSEVEELDDSVDQLHEAIKLYLTEVSHEAIDTGDNRRAIDVITFTTNLEHVGDIIDKNLMELANKKIRNRLQFSPEGLQEICGMHARLMDNLRLALNVFIAGDVKLARKLLEEKVARIDQAVSSAQARLDRVGEQRSPRQSVR